MMGFHLTEVYNNLLELGLARSKREFSRTLEHHWSYVRDMEQRGRDEFRVPPATVERLRTRLRALTPFLSEGIAAEIEGVLANIDQHTAVADALRQTGRGWSSKFRRTSNRRRA